MDVLSLKELARPGLQCPFIESGLLRGSCLIYFSSQHQDIEIKSPGPLPHSKSTVPHDTTAHWLTGVSDQADTKSQWSMLALLTAQSRPPI